MEQLFTYEYVKQLVVYTAYMAIIIMDFYWLGYLIASASKWCFKKIKAIIAKFKKPKAEPTDKVTDKK